MPFAWHVPIPPNDIRSLTRRTPFAGEPPLPKPHWIGLLVSPQAPGHFYVAAPTSGRPSAATRLIRRHTDGGTIRTRLGQGAVPGIVQKLRILIGRRGKREIDLGS